MRAIIMAAIASIGLSISACTPGAIGPSGNSNGAAAVTIDVNLTTHMAISSPLGMLQGYAPETTTVAVGTSLRFVNSDGFAHTATSIAGATFPASTPFTLAAFTPGGSLLSAGWSSGDLAAGAASQTFIADKPGTYLFGCAHHYGAPMRGSIVVQ
ncbi:MAG: plastocyanin/azurin family copper-binding protein [Candidatus Eremiobacteraeota bacterium]|nr:plastocyanin/azurin family copper-binding protein [Candidatus Eremiobacteraeota bacterium]